MGRNAKPAQLHLLEGNKNRIPKETLERRKAAEESMTFKSDAIKAPSWLNSEAKKIFNKLVKDFAATDILVNVDVHALALFCDNYHDYITFTKIIEEEGLQIEHTNKAGETNKVPHPLLTKKKQAFDVMDKISGQFGLTPVARARLALSLQKDNDEDDNPFSGRL